MKREDLKKFDLTPLGSYNLEKVFASIILDLRRSKDNDYYPVKYRVTYNQKQHYYPAMDLTLQEFHDLHKAVRGVNQLKTKKLILAGFKKITTNIEELASEEGFTLEGLARRIRKGTSDSINDAFSSKIERLNQEGRVTSASSYKSAIINIQKYAKKDLKFSDITVDWLKRYEAHLIKEKRSLATIRIYMICLRSILNDNPGLINASQYPFGKGSDKYKVRKGSRRRIALSLTQIDKILKYSLPTDEGRKYRDLWYFSFLCNGINVNDLLRLRFSNIVGGEILYRRGKTSNTNPDQEEIRATLLPVMDQIIKRWGNKRRKPENYIFPFLHDNMTPADVRKEVQNITKLINKRMKKIGEGLKYGNITTNSSRHSFATALMTGGVNIAFISKSLGHSTQKTTQTYLESFDQKTRAKIASILVKK